jgi:hypothetical protein
LMYVHENERISVCRDHVWHHDDELDCWSIIIIGIENLNDFYY